MSNKPFYTSLKPLYYLIIVIGLFSCGVYSFTGAKPCAECKTVSVQYFENLSSLGSPNLSQQFTEALKDILIRQSSLSLINKNGDLAFEGNITEFNVKPVSIQANETASLNRLTISVKVKYVNTKQPEQNFERTFTRFSDFDSRKDFSQVETQLVEDVNSQLVQDIFNAALSNW